MYLISVVCLIIGTLTSCNDENAPDNVKAVDLGLPSGTKWANMNVGALSPEDFGDYFAWGETTSKVNYTWDTYIWSDGDKELKKYNVDSDVGLVDNLTELEPEDDAAYVNWGSRWRIPTIEQWEELRRSCTWTWTTQNGVSGHIITSRSNGNSIFLPAAGVYDRTSHGGKSGLYWSRTSGSSNPYGAWSLSSGDYKINTDDYWITRFYGLSVRPVRK